LSNFLLVEMRGKDRGFIIYVDRKKSNIADRMTTPVIMMALLLLISIFLIFKST
jgi:hypothetical protein